MQTIYAHEAIASAGKRLDGLRQNWLNPSDLVRIEPEVAGEYPHRIVPKDTVSAAKLRERTLTKLYNERPQWLVDAHHDLDASRRVRLRLALRHFGGRRPYRVARSQSCESPAFQLWPPGKTYVIGRAAFEKISEVEGLRLSESMKQAFVEFDLQKAPDKDRHRSIARTPEANDAVGRCMRPQQIHIAIQGVQF